jgi:hypothetical protein
MKTIDMRFVRFALCFYTLLCSVCLSLIASHSGTEYFVKTRAHCIVFPRAFFPVIKNKTIRVLASPFEKKGPANNLVTKYTGSHFFFRELQDSKDHIVLKTSRLVANVRNPISVGTGAVLFSDNIGKPHAHVQPLNGCCFPQRPRATTCFRSNLFFINTKPVPRRSKGIKKLFGQL